MRLFNKIKNFFQKISNKHSKIKRLDKGKTEIKNTVVNLEERKEEFIKNIQTNKENNMEKEMKKENIIKKPIIIGDGTGIKKINL